MEDSGHELVRSERSPRERRTRWSVAMQMQMSQVGPYSGRAQWVTLISRAPPAKSLAFQASLQPILQLMGGTIGPAPLLPRREDPSVANIIAGFCTTGFLPVSLFLEIMATGLKRKPPPPPEPHRTGMLVRLLAKILCFPSQTSFVTICFAFVLEFLPSNLPKFRRERIQRKARAGSPPLFADFEGYNGHDKVSL